MIIKLTHYQARVLMARIPDLHSAAMVEHRTVHGPKAHAYDLPAIAWRQIRDHLWLNPSYYGPLGGKLGSQPKALYRAIQIVHTAVMEMEHHPALGDQAALGRHSLVVPCWARLSGEPRFHPYPAFGRAFLLRLPRVVELHGMEMTEWNSWHQDFPIVGASWTYESAPHLAFAEFKVESHTSPASISWG